ncbi:MAG: YidC/Oxa1 family membrane protein insertase [Candidatus Taylorbacteria bacterium]|nr:YidC/Oxa1 family membrane protein insertase [Candidatus Taylorbacteria bacterium]
MRYIYNSFIYEPLYNGLIILVDLLKSLSWVDAGIIIILFTIIVKLVLFPLSKKAVRTQAVMKLVEPELAALKEKYKGDKQAQAVHIMNFYKEKGINPFSSIFLLFIQLPIIFALYKVFYATGFTSIHTELLYSFVSVPPLPSPLFLGILDVTEKSAVLAVLAAVSQYFQIKLSVPVLPKKTGGERNFQEDFARNMQVQMKYVLPVMILFISYHVAGALALYWITSNLFTIGQELVIRRQLERERVAAKAVVKA